MPAKLNPASQQYTLLSGVTGAGVTSDDIFRGSYMDHMIQVSTSGSTAQTFTVYTSADGDVWTAIRDHTDCDSTVAGYTQVISTSIDDSANPAQELKELKIDLVSDQDFTAVIRKP